MPLPQQGKAPKLLVFSANAPAAVHWQWNCHALVVVFGFSPLLLIGGPPPPFPAMFVLLFLSPLRTSPETYIAPPFNGYVHTWNLWGNSGLNPPLERRPRFDKSTLNECKCLFGPVAQGLAYSHPS